MLIVVDTNVLVSALLGPGGSSREVLRCCLNGIHTPLMGTALIHEVEDVMARDELMRDCVLSLSERTQLVDAFLKVCRWTRIYYTWRPNLKDESDNHLIDLAVAGGAAVVVTKNLRDLRAAEMKFPGLRIVSPDQFIKE
jgi:uncharacterized protein